MNRTVIVSLIQKNIDELILLTQGFMEMNEYPRPILDLAQHKTEDIKAYIQMLRELKAAAGAETVVAGGELVEEVEDREVNEVREVKEEEENADAVITSDEPEAISITDVVKDIEYEVIVKETEQLELVEKVDVVEQVIDSPEQVQELEQVQVQKQGLEMEQVQVQKQGLEMQEMEQVQEMEQMQRQEEIKDVNTIEEIEEIEEAGDEDEEEYEDDEDEDIEEIEDEAKIEDLVEIEDEVKDNESDQVVEVHPEAEVPEVKNISSEDSKPEEKANQDPQQPPRITTLGEKMASGGMSRNDSMARENNGIHASIINKKVDDIRQAISLGDRFRFQRELFRNNGEDMNKTLSYINLLATYDEVVSFLQSKYAWPDDSSTAKDFYQIIRRKF
jgi:hypothetical protein